MSFNPRKYLTIAKAIAKGSKCVRPLANGGPAHFAALVIDPTHDVLLAYGYNGWLRNCADTCGGGGGLCARKDLSVKSGERIEVGCVHAEMNALANCCRQGVRTTGMVMLIPGEPCSMCAKLIVQAGIATVYIGANQYPQHGIALLTLGGVEWEFLTGGITLPDVAGGKHRRASLKKFKK